MNPKVVILAAGKGTRMRSSLPKVLQPLANQPLLGHVIETAKQVTDHSIITIVGHGAELVQAHFKSSNIHFIEQAEQLGTGHAVQQAVSLINDNDTVLILYGDVPLTRTETLNDLLSLVDDMHPLALLTITLEDASGYGRIVRDQHHQVQAIIEEKDATPFEKEICEINTGILAAKGVFLKAWLNKLSNDNAQDEYYLTDIIAMCVEEGYQVHTTEPNSIIEVLGVNNKQQLHNLERQYQRQLADTLMTQGVTVIDANRIDIRGQLTVSENVSIDVNVIFEGEVFLGQNVQIGANCIVKNCTIGDNTVIEPFSHLEEASVSSNCRIGPYARLRPGTELSEQVRVGNFVELKKAKIGQGSKINHLSYIGDTMMGEECNIGAGTITCNYDGVNKHLTEIGDRVFVGSDTQLVAPVKVNADATIGAGSTITKEVPENELTLSRSKQLTLKGWQKPSKQGKQP